MKLGLGSIPLFAISTLLFTGAAWADHPPGPISILPDFHCNPAEGDTPESCFQKATAALKENFLGLDLQQAEHPDLNGPSDYWGQSEYALTDHRVPTVAILMHGMFEDGRQLAPEAAWLAERGIPVLNIILAGHGVTNGVADEVLYSDWVEDAERAMRLALALGDRVILVGHSTGGALSVYLGIKYPQSVAAAILIEPAVRVTTLVQTAACMAQHGISNIAAHPTLLKIYGISPSDLHNQVIAPAAGCEVKGLRTAALSLLPQDELSGNESDKSRALGAAFKAPLLLFNNLHDIVVDSDQNEAFAEGVALQGISKEINFNQDRQMPHGSLTFAHPDWIINEIDPFLRAQGIVLSDPFPHYETPAVSVPSAPSVSVMPEL